MHAMTSLKPIDKIGNITDGNILTYFQATDMTSAITFKLEKESSISRITFLPVMMIIILVRAMSTNCFIKMECLVGNL